MLRMIWAAHALRDRLTQQNVSPARRLETSEESKQTVKQQDKLQLIQGNEMANYKAWPQKRVICTKCDIHEGFTVLKEQMSVDDAHTESELWTRNMYESAKGDFSRRHSNI